MAGMCPYASWGSSPQGLGRAVKPSADAGGFSYLGMGNKSLAAKMAREFGGFRSVKIV